MASACMRSFLNPRVLSRSLRPIAPLRQLRPTTSALQQRPQKWTATSNALQRSVFHSSARNYNASTEKPEVLAALEQKPKDKVEKVLNVPNILTFGRLFSAPVIGWLILNDYHTASLALFATAGFTDAIDGWIARKWNLQTVVGSVIDPMADKTLMTIITICLAVKGVFPIWLAGIILGRDVALALSAIYFRYISLPPPKTMKRYWDFSLPSAEVHPTTISKLNTALQLGLVGAAVMDPLMGGSADWAAAFEAMQYTVATTTVWSGASYIYTKDAVKILKHPDVPASFIKRYQKDEEWKELEKKEAEKKEAEKNEEVKP